MYYDVPVRARLYGPNQYTAKLELGYTSWLEVDVNDFGKTKSFDTEQTGVGFVTGKYMIQITTLKSRNNASNYWGTWYYY